MRFSLRSTLIAIVASCFTIASVAQNRPADSLNSLEDESSILWVKPKAVGIGTSSPFAQFHTTGSVRLSGIGINNDLVKIMVQDALGNVFYRDASTIMQKEAWSTAGNGGTNPFVQFLGTTDFQRLAIRTNNVERLTVAANGYIGVNNNVPNRIFTLNGSNPHDNAEIWMRQTIGSELGAYLTLDNRANPGGQMWSIGSTGPLNSPTVPGALEFYQFGFGTRMMMDASGRLGVGIGNGVLPTATLHTSGPVRLQNLPNGTGNVLVVDANGNVFKSSYSARLSGAPENAEIKQLKSEVENLRAEVEKLKQLIKGIK